MCTSGDSDQPAHPGSLISLRRALFYVTKDTNRLQVNNDDSDQLVRICSLDITAIALKACLAGRTCSVDPAYSLSQFTPCCLLSIGKEIN